MRKRAKGVRNRISLPRHRRAALPTARPLSGEMLAGYEPEAALAQLLSGYHTRNRGLYQEPSAAL